jgi:hypothetical protein
LHAFAQDRNLQSSAAMNEPRGLARRGAVAIGLSLSLAGCGGFTNVSPTAPSATSATLTTQTSVPSIPAPAPTHAVGPDVPAGLAPTEQVITGTVGPLMSYPAACYVGLYACERYRFTLQPQEGAVEVTLSWQGGARAMLIQLYRAGAGLVHEDLAPRDGSPTITFRRVGLEPMQYELRVVNMEPAATHPFTLTLTTWQ